MITPPSTLIKYPNIWTTKKGNFRNGMDHRNCVYSKPLKNNNWNPHSYPFKWLFPEIIQEKSLYLNRRQDHIRHLFKMFTLINAPRQSYIKNIVAHVAMATRTQEDVPNYVPYHLSPKSLGSILTNMPKFSSPTSILAINFHPLGSQIRVSRCSNKKISHITRPKASGYDTSSKTNTFDVWFLIHLASSGGRWWKNAQKTQVYIHEGGERAFVCMAGCQTPFGVFTQPCQESLRQITGIGLGLDSVGN